MMQQSYSGYISKRMEIRISGICTPIFTVALSQQWRQENNPNANQQMDELIKKTQHIHAMKYYSALERKEIQPYATIWIKLEDSV